MTSFVRALYDIAVEDGNTSQLEAIRNLCFQKLAVGEAKSLVSSSVNGKSFSFAIQKSADVLFAETAEAIRLFNYGSQPATELDFSQI